MINLGKNGAGKRRIIRFYFFASYKRAAFLECINKAASKLLRNSKRHLMRLFNCTRLKIKHIAQNIPRHYCTAPIKCLHPDYSIGEGIFCRTATNYPFRSDTNYIYSTAAIAMASIFSGGTLGSKASWLGLTIRFGPSNFFTRRTSSATSAGVPLTKSS